MQLLEIYIFLHISVAWKMHNITYTKRFKNFTQNKTATRIIFIIFGPDGAISRGSVPPWTTQIKLQTSPEGEQPPYLLAAAFWNLPRQPYLLEEAFWSWRRNIIFLQTVPVLLYCNCIGNIQYGWSTFSLVNLVWMCEKSRLQVTPEFLFSTHLVEL